MNSYNYYWPPPVPSSGYAAANPPGLSNPARTAADTHINNIAPSVLPSAPSSAINLVPVSSGQGIFLRVINPNNKKDWQDYTLRGIKRDTMDSPAKMRQIITDQCGEGVAPEEIGYFEQSNKHWIHNRLDLHDVWSKIEGGAKITLWCMCNEPGISKARSTKRSSTEEENKTEKKQKLCSSRELAEEYEKELTEKHGSKYTRFQYKLWAEMLASGVHEAKDEPPAASMFTRGTKQQKQQENHDSVVTGMMSVMNTLCQAVTSKPSPSPTGASPARKAELRSTYIKQLGELRRLYDSDVLNVDEYEEQRSHIVSLMRELK